MSTFEDYDPERALREQYGERGYDPERGFRGGYDELSDDGISDDDIAELIKELAGNMSSFHLDEESIQSIARDAERKIALESVPEYTGEHADVVNVMIDFYRDTTLRQIVWIHSAWDLVQCLSWGGDTYYGWLAFEHLQKHGAVPKEFFREPDYPSRNNAA